MGDHHPHRSDGMLHDLGYFEVMFHQVSSAPVEQIEEWPVELRLALNFQTGSWALRK